MATAPTPFSSGLNSGAAAKGPGYTLGRRLITAVSHEFPLIEGFLKGYRNREDVTVLPAGVLVPGSQNVLTNTFERVGVRQGYQIDGQSSVVLAPIASWFDQTLHTGDEVHLRTGFLSAPNIGKMQFRYVAAAGDKWNGNTFTAGQVFWIDLLTGLPSVNFNYTTFFDTPAELKTFVLMVNGTDKLWAWTGAVATLAGASNAAGAISAVNVNALNGGHSYVIGDAITITGGGGAGGAATVTSTVDGAISTLVIGSAGGGYVVNDILTLSQNGTGATVKVTAIGGGGTVTAFTILTEGLGYGILVTSNTTGGTGTGATFTITAIANGVVSGILLTAPGSGYAITTGAATAGGSGVGAQVDITAVAQGVITITGADSVAQEGFVQTTNYSQTLLINNNVYNYTGSVGNSFTGITPDPSAEPLQSVIVQRPTPYTVKSITGLGLPTVDLISNLNNYIYYGNLTNNNFFISKLNNFKDCTFSAPVRIYGEGFQGTLRSPPYAFQPQTLDQTTTTMAIFAGKDSLYINEFILSADLTKETILIQPQKTTRKQGAQSQKWVTKIKNDIAYLSFEPIINTFGPVTDIYQTQQVTDISSSITNDIENYDPTDGSIMYDLNYVYACFPKNGVVRIYNMTNPKNIYWEAPQTIPIAGISIINGELYGHSYLTSQTFKLFTGYNDIGNPIPAVAKFSFNQYGTRTYTKSFNEYYVEGYISSNATINLAVQYDFNPAGSPITKTISGSDPQIILNSGSNASLGKVSLGKNPLGSSSQGVSTVSKFRVIKIFTRKPFFEEQTTISSSGVDFQWEIIALGAGASPTSEGNNFIKS